MRTQACSLISLLNATAIHLNSRGLHEAMHCGSEEPGIHLHYLPFSWTLPHCTQHSLPHPWAHNVLLFSIPHSVTSGCYLEFSHGGYLHYSNQQSLETSPFGELASQHNSLWPSANYSIIRQILYLPPFPDLLLFFILPKAFPTWLANYSPLTFCSHFGPTLNLVISLLQATFHLSVRIITLSVLLLLESEK